MTPITVIERAIARPPLRRRWWLGVGAALLLGAAAVAAVESAHGRYRVAIDIQKYYACLPFEVFLVDTRPTRPLMRGDLAQFMPPAAATEFTTRVEVVKIVAAVAGDRWQVQGDELFVNGRLWGRLHLLARLSLKPGALDGAGTVPRDHVLVLGTTPSSYDSRYWGPLPVSLVKGIAHVVV
jgi:conjugal transfer pilin signal peptidase TrbI